jgi:signal transduction histidine kinase
VFSPIGRRLALLNAAIVVLVIALVGGSMFVLLQHMLVREEDRSLVERARAAELFWSDLFLTGQPEVASLSAATVRPQEDERHDDDHGGEREREDHEAREVLRGGDTLLFAFDATGQLLADERGVPIPGLPLEAAVAEALQGRADTRTVRLADEIVRVYTRPVVVDGRIAGAIQAARGQARHETELRLVGLVSVMGIGIGGVIAVPAGLFLARRAMRPIDAAFAKQRAFVADASHELRAPLTLIRANAELVSRLPDASPAVKDEIANMLQELDGMSRLVDDLLLLARLDDAALTLDRQPLDLAETAQPVVTAMEEVARAAGLRLSLRVERTVVVSGDVARIRQVLRNLLDNAIRYTPAGGKIEVLVGQRNGRGLVQVSDTGIGIAPEDQPRVFDRFFRADRARTRSSGGTGLGLAIARAIVLAHGGDIGLESEPGVGTTVWFTLPAAGMGAGGQMGARG